MPVYRANKVGSIGYIDQNDLRPHELPPPAWSLVSEARMINGAASSVNGPVAANLNPNLGDSEAHALDYYTSPAGTEQWWYAYTDTKIMSVDNNGNVNTVSSGLTDILYPDNVWVTDQLNGIPIATNNRDAPQCFYNAGGPITNLTLSQAFPDWGPGGTYDGATAKIVRAYKNFIVALNINDNGAFPNLVAWSDAADPGLMPTTWDYNDPTNLAGRAVIGAGYGAIVGAEILRDSLYIYFERATFKMDFVGGTFIMRFTRVFENSGAFGPRCIGKFQEKHLVISKSDIVVHDGQQMVSVGDERVRNRVLQGIDEEDANRLWVSPFLKYDEMWVGVPDFAVALVFQWDDSTWSVRSLPSSRYMKELPTLQASETDDTWDGGPDVSWDGGPNNPWNESSTIGDLVPVATSVDTNLYFMDAGAQVADTILHRSDMNLGGDEHSEMAVAVYPKIRGSEAIQIRVGGSNSVEGPITWGRWTPFVPGQDYRVTARAMGRRHAIEFMGKNFELEGYNIPWESAGSR